MYNGCYTYARCPPMMQIILTTVIVCIAELSIKTLHMCKKKIFKKWMLYSVKFWQGKTGEFVRLRTNSPMFYPSNSTWYICSAKEQICQSFPYQNVFCTNSPKFYLARILRYMVYAEINVWYTYDMK